MLHGAVPKRKGGWRGNPNSLANLVYFPHQIYRLCVRCRRAALKASRFCFKHSRTWRNTQPGRSESRLLDKLWRAGLVPPELQALQVWIGLSTVSVVLRGPARLALVMLWHDRLTRPLDWARAWRNALALQGYKREGTQRWEAA